MPSTIPVAVALVMPSIQRSRTCFCVQSKVVMLQYSSPSLHKEITSPVSSRRKLCMPLASAASIMPLRW